MQPSFSGWWWALSMLLLFVSAVAVIIMTIQRFISNPTYISQKEKIDNKMEFPAVFVCPGVRFADSKIDIFLENIKIPAHLNKTYLKSTIRQLAAFYASDVFYDVNSLESLEYLLEYNVMTLDTAARLLTATCEETLIRCRWAGMLVNCSELFFMDLTGDGYCCVFNGRCLKRHYGNHDHYTTRMPGPQTGLMLAINQSQKPIDIDLTYTWVSFQTSQHYVEPTINGTALNPGSEQWSAYYVRSFQIDEDARRLSNRVKKCQMFSEPLEFFPNYHKSYCVVECEMHRTLDRCGCVRNIHPVPIGARYCRASELRCAYHAKVPYDSEECRCPMACDVPSSYIKSSSFPLIPSSKHLDSFYEGLNFEKVTILRAFMKDRNLKILSRSSLFNDIDLFGELGGVFNLFFGCSILTLLELATLGLHGLKIISKKIFQKKIGNKTSNLTEDETKK